MRKTAYFLLGLALFAPFCNADPRWCSIVGRGPSDTLVYPPIARAAVVSGVVISRVIYLPAGQVVDVEAISGPRMLSDAISSQIRKWSIKTDSSGDLSCETLVVADFRLHDSSDPTTERASSPVEPSILRLSIDAEKLCLCDPGVTFGTENALFRFWRAVKRGMSKTFRHHAKPWELGSDNFRRPWVNTWRAEPQTPSPPGGPPAW
jgi:hypothetical protein